MADYDVFQDFTAEEIAMIRASSEAEQRADDYRAELAAAKDSFEAYWAGSPSASVLRDYRAGRVVNV